MLDMDSKAELNKRRGARLKECRRLREYTQEQFGEASGYNKGTIAAFENGRRSIDAEKAEVFAEILNVNPSYILCKSNIVEKKTVTTPLDKDTYGNTDKLFLLWLTSMGYKLSFFVVKLFDGNKPIVKEKHGKQYADYKALEMEVPIDNIVDYCFSDSVCKIKEGDVISEAVFVSVKVNDALLSYGQFVFLVNRFYDYAAFTLDKLNSFKSDYEYQTMGTDSEIEERIKSSRGSSIPYKNLREELKKIDSEIEITNELPSDLAGDNNKEIE